MIITSPWSGVLIEQLTVTQLVNKSPAKPGPGPLPEPGTIRFLDAEKFTT
jgi:hypothetical protein